MHLCLYRHTPVLAPESYQHLGVGCSGFPFVPSTRIHARAGVRLHSTPWKTASPAVQTGPVTRRIEPNTLDRASKRNAAPQKSLHRATGLQGAAANLSLGLSRIIYLCGEQLLLASLRRAGH